MPPPQTPALQESLQQSEGWLQPWPSAVQGGMLQKLPLGSQKPEQHSWLLAQKEPLCVQLPEPQVFVDLSQTVAQHSESLTQNEPSGSHVVSLQMPVCGLQMPLQQSLFPPQPSPVVPQLSQVAVARSQARLQHSWLSMQGCPSGWQVNPPH